MTATSPSITPAFWLSRRITVSSHGPAGRIARKRKAKSKSHYQRSHLLCTVVGQILANLLDFSRENHLPVLRYFA
jgi:hypothetical protein